MNMCTVKSIQDAIRECCQSQHDMEPIEIDQIVDNLPFFKEKSLFDTPPLPKPPTQRSTESGPTAADRRNSFWIAAFFMP